MEADKIVGLETLLENKFCFGLANGTVGVYQSQKRQWRVKSKHQLQTIAAFDLDADGVPEVISGWSNGGLSVRNCDTGQVRSSTADRCKNWR